MSLTRLFVARPTLVFVLVAIMSFAGIIALSTIVKQLFPDVDQPTVTVTVQYNGASVTEMRDNIVAPIEQYLAGTTDLQTFSSVVQQGQATITATFLITSDIATDLALVEKDIQSAEKVLPTNITPPSISIRDPSESTIATLALYSRKLSTGDLSLYAQNVIAPKIEQLPGISYANVGGLVTPAYEIDVDPQKLVAAGLTLNDVITTVGDDNVRVPGGTVYEPNRWTNVDVRGDIQNVDTVAKLPIQLSSGASTTATTGDAGQTATYTNGIEGLPGTVDTWTASDAVRRIEDVASVIAGYEPRQQYAQVNGIPGLFLNIQKSSDASEVDASNAVLAALPKIERQFPGISFKVINVQSKFTEQQIDLVTRTLMEAVVLTAIAMVFFLRSWRNALVVCVSIPTSLAIALSAMKLFGFTLDTISLLGMSLVIGILVDDSTVVLENIERHFTELKQTPENAAIYGREEIGAAAIVITLVDVVVFFPIAFIQGQVGRQLVEFAIVVVISTLTSLFVSFTVTPTLAGLWALKSHWKPPGFIDAFTRGFDATRDFYANRIYPWGLRNAALVALFCAVTFVLAIAMIPLGVVGEEFIPTTDRGQIFVQMTYPIGSPLERVRAGAFKLEHLIDQQHDVDAEATSAGAYSASFGGFVTQSNVAQDTIFLKDDRVHDTEYWVHRIAQIAHRSLPADVTTVVVPSTGQTGGNKQPIDFIVSDTSGGDPTAAAQKVLALLARTPGATNVNSSGTSLAPEISVEFDRAKMQALDVSLGEAAEAAGAAFGGDVATQFETPAGLEQVQVIYPLDDQHALDALGNVPIRAQNGSIVHLSDFATFQSTPTSPLVTRTDRLNVIHVDANFALTSSLSNVQSAFVAGLPSLNLPPNITVTPAPLGQQDFMNQTLAGLGASLIVSIILVFLLMVALYNSYRDPFIIIFSVPVAAVGAIGALIATHRTLNLFSLIGTILLVGIATKNGILLVDYANTLRARGMSKVDAMKESAFTRFRPIVMTSFSVIFGNIPLALALEPGSGSRSSLGIVIIGGVLSSLVLTLVLIPNMYLWLSPEHLPVKKTAPDHPNGAAVPPGELPVPAH
jgi:HAE1 family hydrophobic/amphiphilic exporter-1